MSESTKPTSNEAENGNKSKPLLSSRLFKFRAWDTDNNEFVNCEDHQIRQMQTDYGGLGNRFIYSQFIGLVDKNGNEIFEGDIILCDRIYWEEERNLIVKYDEESAAFYLLNKKDSVDSETFEKTSCFCVGIYEREVIGNIFENPELL